MSAQTREAARCALLEGRWEEAKSGFDHWVQAQPDSVEALHGLGLVLAQQGRSREAAERLGAAHLLAPSDIEILRNLGVVLGHAMRLEKAAECLAEVLERSPSDAVAARHLVRAYVTLGRPADALEIMSSFPGLDFGASALEAKAAVCDWRTRDADLSQLALSARAALRDGRPAPCSPFGAIILDLPPDLVRPLGRAAAPPTSRPPEAPRAPRRAGPWRVGYLSPDLHDHPVGLLLAPVLEHHSSRFDVRSYALVDADDDVRRRIAKAAPLISMVDASDDEVFARIAGDELDLLVDLAGFTSSARHEVLARRPAPVQAHWLGYPGSLPSSLIDWQITHESRLGAEGEAAFDEPLALLPDTFVATEGFPEPVTPPRRSQHGLPDSAFVYGFFGAGYRITPELFDGWMLVLRSNSESLMWLQAEGLQRDFLRREARARGVDPARLRFAPRGRLSVQHHHTLADLWLDGWHVSSGTAGIIAAWTGTPILTLAGPTPPSCTGAGVLHGARTPELIAESREAYLERAIYWGAHPEALRPVRARLAQARRTAPLFDVERFTGDLERAYAEMIARSARGETPSTFRV
ncbi:MAG: hypothetical protein AAFZ18_03210 [Myxococcota bacterium]